MEVEVGAFLAAAAAAATVAEEADRASHLIRLASEDGGIGWEKGGPVSPGGLSRAHDDLMRRR